METNYTVEYFIRKFSAIPESLWCIDQFDSHTGEHCAFGHCYENKMEYESLKTLFEFFPVTHNRLRINRYSMGGGLGGNVVAPINNGDTNEYRQPTPKQRILAALYDIKKMQEPQYENITKELAILPINETSDKVDKLQLVL